MNNPIRVNDQYLINELKLTPGFIAHHARAMGNRTKPRAYFLDTVLAYLRGLELEMQRKYAARRVHDLNWKENVLRDIEAARIAVQARKRRIA
jgi:hypothetical protein